MIRKISIWGTALKLLFPAHCLRRGRGPHTLLNQNSLCVVKWQQRRWQVCTKAPAAKSSAAHLPTHALSLSVRMWGCQPGCSTRWQWRPKHRDRPKCGWASPEQAVLLHSCSLRITRESKRRPPHGEHFPFAPHLFIQALGGIWLVPTPLY